MSGVGTTHISLSKESQDLIKEYCDRYGMVKKAVLSDLVEWWVHLDPTVRSLITDGPLCHPHDMPKIARIILERIASGEEVVGVASKLMTASTSGPGV